MPLRPIFEVTIMEKYRNKHHIKIVDAVEYNGKYVDPSSIRNRIIAIGAVFLGVIGIISVPLLLI